MAPLASTPSVESVRSRFPSIASGFAFCENAGGSQMPGCVIEAMKQYALESYVQLGAGYPAAVRATETIDRARVFAEELVGGKGQGRTSFGPSSSILLRLLADAYGERWNPGNEIIIAEAGHEANIGCWLRLERLGAKIVWWKVDPDAQNCRIEDLPALLSPRTRLVVLPHVSNLLGEIADVQAVVALAKQAGARVVVDGVAYAPHRAMQVADWGVDWYVFSAYKVYAPHLAVLWGREDAAAEVVGSNHFFVSDKSPTKFELGCQSHEGIAGLLATKEYLDWLGGGHGLAVAFDAMAALELPLQRRFVDYLRSKPGVRVVGPQHGESSRVATISFVHDRVPADAIVAAVDRHPIGIRHGHMYAYRLCEALGIAPEPGVVRVSFVHYNTLGEVERLIDVLETVL